MITGILYAVLIILGAVALIMCASALWAAMWHSDPKHRDVDALVESREEKNRKLLADPTWRPGKAS